ncbi:MAG TPA: hypothetical protein VIK14_10075 [Ignavibacteria bacterium]
MNETIFDYLRNMDLIDYLGILTTIVIVIAYFSGSIFLFYNFIMTKLHLYKSPRDPYYDPREH